MIFLMSPIWMRFGLLFVLRFFWWWVLCLWWRILSDRNLTWTISIIKLTCISKEDLIVRNDGLSDRITIYLNRALSTRAIPRKMTNLVTVVALGFVLPSLTSLGTLSWKVSLFAAFVAFVFSFLCVTHPLPVLQSLAICPYPPQLKHFMSERLLLLFLR